MTSLFEPNGGSVPVTVVELGPCVVTQIKTKATDGYDALQLGFGTKKIRRLSKPLLGHMRAAGGNFAVLREVSVEDPSAYSVGQSIGTDIFKVGDRVDVIGTTKGRGFAGVIKRHGFSGNRATHGVKMHRVPGSVGNATYPGRVVKGKKLPGQYGNHRQTMKHLQIVDIRPDQNLVLLRGAVPGHRMGLVLVNQPQGVR
jgi:large subunit ribosomal protein L3